MKKIDTTIIVGWLTILVSVLGLLIPFFTAADFTIPAILGLVVGIINVVIGYLTKTEFRAMQARIK